MRQRNIIILAIILMAVGFAAVATNLIINGSTTIGNNIDDLNVYFSKVAENGIENNSLIKDNTHISFAVDLMNVDDVYELKYEVTNASRNYDLDITIDVTEGNDYIGITNEFDTKTLLSRTKREGKLTIKLKKAVTEATTYQVKVEMTANVAERTSLGTDELNYVNLTGLSLNGNETTVSGKEFTIELTDNENMLTYYVTNSNREYDVDTTITCEGAGLTIENHFENKILNGNTVREGKLKVTGSGTLKCTITTGLPISRDTLASNEITEEPNTDEIEPFPPHIVNAVTGDGTHIGDELAIGDEHFYVLSNDGTTITMLAKYNLEVGNSSNSKYPADTETNIQSPRAIGHDSSANGNHYATVKYGNNNTYQGSVVEGYVNNYVRILKEKYDVEVSGRLLTKGEIDNLAGKELGETQLRNYPNIPTWVYSTSYWLSSPHAGTIYMKNVNSNSSLYHSNAGANDSYGVRPVITISASLI